MSEMRESIFNDKDDMVECQGCGNKVNQSQIHDKQKLICIGCFHRQDNQGDTYSKHNDIESPDHRQDIGENLLTQYKSKAEAETR